MPEKNKPEVVILGGGVFGFSIAYQLAKEGIPSQVIEADSIGAKASGRAGGMISSSICSYFYSRGARKLLSTSIPLMAEGYQRFPDLYNELKELTGLDMQYATYPLLECAMSDEEEQSLRNIVDEVNLKGLGRVKWLSGNEARSLENNLSGEVRGAVLVNCAQVESYRYTLALAQAAENLGATIRYAQAAGFRCKNNRVTSVLISNGDEVAAEKFVIAMGPWSAQALAWLGLRMPVVAFRAQTLKMATQTEFRCHAGFKPPAKKGCRHIYMIFAPRVEMDGTVIVGYTEDSGETWDDNFPETWNDSPTEEMKEFIIEQALRFIPCLEDARLVEHRAGLLADPPGEKMAMGNLSKWENVYIATAGDGGIGRSPAVGRIMTDLIVGGIRAKSAAELIRAIDPNKLVV